jgi:hypothetical protein
MISAVAYEVGYESISQRRLFNLTPSEDAVMLRASLQAESRAAVPRQTGRRAPTRISHLN